LLIFFSAFTLSDYESKEVAFLIPQSSVYAGELLHLPAKGEYLIGGKKASYYNGRQFAVVGLSKNKQIRITKIIDRKSSFYHRLFGGKIYRSEHQVLEMKRPKLYKDNLLRLPASVWKKVNRQDKIQQERNKLRKILNTEYANDDLGCLQYPIESVRVSKFAAPRTLPNGYAYYHTGLDLRSRSPEPILSMGDGKVILAEHMTSPGNMVIVHHGKGLVSRYMHLSKIDVQVGQQVKKGEAVGLSGGTGRVEAPHLHWEIMWKGNHANPEHFVPLWNRHCSPT